MKNDQRANRRWLAGLAVATGVGMTLLAVSGSAAARPGVAPTARTAAGVGAGASVAAPHGLAAHGTVTLDPVLYNQNNADAYDGYIDTSDYDSQGADDFVVPAGETWHLNSVSTTGSDDADLSSVTVTIYADSSGAPGTQDYTVTVPAGSFTDAPGQFGFDGGDLTIPITTTLTAGHYWLSVVGTGGVYYWEIRHPVWNDPALWQNPDDLFGTGCTTWADVATCFNNIGIDDGPPDSLDFMFSLSGTTTFTGNQLAPGQTTCNGTYGGTRSDLTVLKGATCTLVSGTNITHDLKVQKGGTLHATDITIGHDLIVDGTATVCGSQIGHNLTADGAVTIGGTGCPGDTVGLDLTVQNDKGGATITDTWVGRNLQVLNNTGGELITGSVAGLDMLIQHNGSPTTVTGNDVGRNAICKNNLGQTASGNSAGGTNTCPPPL